MPIHPYDEAFPEASQSRSFLSVHQHRALAMVEAVPLRRVQRIHVANACDGMRGYLAQMLRPAHQIAVEVDLDELALVQRCCSSLHQPMRSQRLHSDKCVDGSAALDVLSR